MASVHGEYRGQVVEGKRHGYGTYRRRDKYAVCGASYEGEWENDEMHGLGVRYYKNVFYKGTWFEGERRGHGQLTCSYTHNTLYVGEWANDKYHGHGKYTPTQGEAKSGIWDQGKLITTADATAAITATATTVAAVKTAAAEARKAEKAAKAATITATHPVRIGDMRKSVSSLKALDHRASSTPTTAAPTTGTATTTTATVAPTVAAADGDIVDEDAQYVPSTGNDAQSWYARKKQGVVNADVTTTTPATTVAVPVEQPQKKQKVRSTHTPGPLVTLELCDM
jgi:hypothetical protein